MIIVRAVRIVLAFPVRALAWALFVVGFTGNRSARAVAEIANFIEGKP